MVQLLFIDSEMLPSALLWFLFSTLIDWLVDNELSVHFGWDENNRTNRYLLQEHCECIG